MHTDWVLVSGILVALLAIPSFFAAFADSRPPRAAAFMIMIGGGAIIYAVMANPGGYAIGDVPDLFVRVFAQIF